MLNYLKLFVVVLINSVFASAQTICKVPAHSHQVLCFWGKPEDYSCSKLVLPKIEAWFAEAPRAGLTIYVAATWLDKVELFQAHQVNPTYLVTSLEPLQLSMHPEQFLVYVDNASAQPLSLWLSICSNYPQGSSYLGRSDNWDCGELSE